MNESESNAEADDEIIINESRHGRPKRNCGAPHFTNGDLDHAVRRSTRQRRMVYGTFNQHLINKYPVAGSQFDENVSLVPRKESKTASPPSTPSPPKYTRELTALGESGVDGEEQVSLQYLIASELWYQLGRNLQAVGKKWNVG